MAIFDADPANTLLALPGWVLEGQQLSFNADAGSLTYREESGWLRVKVEVGRGNATEMVGALAVTVTSIDGASVNAEALRAFPLGAWREALNKYRLHHLGGSFADRVCSILASRPALNPDWRDLIPSLENDVAQPDVGDADEVTGRFADAVGLPASDPARTALLELVRSYQDAKSQSEFDKIWADVNAVEPLGRPKRGPVDNSDFYKRLAKRYTAEAAFSRSPARNISVAEGVPIQTVRTWLNRARSSGHLPPGVDDDE